jgi:hypothetical protein
MNCILIILAMQFERKINSDGQTLKHTIKKGWRWHPIEVLIGTLKGIPAADSIEYFSKSMIGALEK